MNVGAIQKRLLHGLIIRHMGQHPQLNLGVVRVYQKIPRPRFEELAQIAAQLGPHRDVLHIRLRRADAAGSCLRLIEGRMDAPILPNQLHKSIHISGFKFGHGTVIQNQRDNGVLILEVIQYIRVGGITGLGLFPCR